MLSSRRGLAGFPARLAMRGRHAAELTHQLRSVMLNTLTRREREFRALRLRLEARDLRRRFAAIRGKLDARDRPAARRDRRAGTIAPPRGSARSSAVSRR